jgi:hypothetical protein
MASWDLPRKTLSQHILKKKNKGGSLIQLFLRKKRDLKAKSSAKENSKQSDFTVKLLKKITCEMKEMKETKINETKKKSEKKKLFKLNRKG